MIVKVTVLLDGGRAVTIDRKGIVVSGVDRLYPKEAEVILRMTDVVAAYRDHMAKPAGGVLLDGQDEAS